MKKFVMIAMIALFPAFGLIGCNNDDGTKADLRWDNQIGGSTNLIEISWTVGSTSNQTWSRADDGAGPTEFKGITELAGTGDAVIEGGGTAILQLSAGDGVASVSGSAATIEENASATLIVNSAK